MLDCLFSSTQEKVLRDEVAARTTPHELTARSATLNGRVGVLSLPESQLVFVRYGGDVIVEAPATESRIVATIPLGPMVVSHGASVHQTTHEKGFLLSRTERTLMNPDPWAGALVVASDEQRLREHRRIVLGDDAREPGSHDAVSSLVKSDLLEHVCRSAWAITSTLPAETPADVVKALLAAIEDHVLTALVLTWAGEDALGAETVPASCGDSRMDVLLDWIRVNHGLAVTVSDMARAVSLSVRQLQAAVQDSLQSSPIALLRDARLVAAHHELQGADPHVTTVAAIAHTHGIAHLGRFSATYRERFGQSPQVTLAAPSTRRKQ